MGRKREMERTSVAARPPSRKARRNARISVRKCNIFGDDGVVLLGMKERAMDRAVGSRIAETTACSSWATMWEHGHVLALYHPSSHPP